MTRARPLFLVPLLLGGCTTTAPQPRPALTLPPPRSSFTIAPASASVQRLLMGAPADARWWKSFGSAKLNALVDRALAANNDIAVADAALRQAQELARAAVGGQGPQIDASYLAQRTRISAALSSPLADSADYLYTLHTAQVTVSYPVDLFGGGRAKVRSARATARAAAARRDAARSTVVANLVIAIIQHASLNAQIEAAETTVQSDGQLVTLLERRRELGDVGLADVAAQQTVLANAQAALPPLIRQRDHETALILSLLGQPAGGAEPDLPSMQEIMLPSAIPVALPSDIIANRPDVRAAAAQMQGAADDVGAAIAARLPSIQITGNAGGSASRFLDMFATGNPFFALLGGITQPLFHSGQLRHQQRAAEAALQQTEAQYRATALQAFLDVDDALSGLKTDGDALDAVSRADAAAQRTLMMVRRQMELGGVGSLALLNASATASQTRAQLVQAKAARLTDTVSLYQSVGAPIEIDEGER